MKNREINLMTLEQLSGLSHPVRSLPPAEMEESITTEIGNILKRFFLDRVALAVLCGALCRIKALRPVGVVRYLAEKYPEHAHNLNWVSKLCRAGNLLLDYPDLRTESIDRLCTLRRVPKRYQDEVYRSGRFPDGACIRDLSREQLAEAVNRLRDSKPPRPEESVYHTVKRDLVHFTNQIPIVLESLARLPEYSAIRETVENLHRQLIETIKEEGPRVPEPLYLPPSLAISRAITVQYSDV